MINGGKNMSDCSSCPSHGKCGNDSGTCGVKNNPLNKVKHVIGVMSGKGGVGKSTVSAMLAKELKKKGYSVGLLDADVTGPSAGRLMGLAGERAYAQNNMIIPVENKDGIKVISLNFMIEDENQPVVWRGAMLSSCVTQFWNETLWGDIDFLIVDMPPGTGDVPLTVFQSLPLTGIVIVTSPQELVDMIVKKAYNMASQMDIPVLGLVQNMSYLSCPDCGKKIYLYGQGNGAQTAKQLVIPSYAELPIEPEIAALCDAGNIEAFNNHHLDDMISFIEKLKM